MVIEVDSVWESPDGVGFGANPLVLKHAMFKFLAAGSILKWFQEKSSFAMLQI